MFEGVDRLVNAFNAGLACFLIMYCAMQRYGKVVQFYISALMLVTMGTALTVEYTTVGAVFTQIIGATQIPIIIIIGIVSSVYTAYGGLHISLITDQVQARQLKYIGKGKNITSPLPYKF